MPVTQRISTLLTSSLYVLFILALSSSVIAFQQPYRVRVLLEDTQDFRLKTGYWGRLLLPPRQDSGIDMRRWSYRRDCDDFIRVNRDREGTEINVYRLLQRNTRYIEDQIQYFLPRPGEGNNLVGAQLKIVYPLVPKDMWDNFLNDTCWGREPDIIGQVSGCAMMWKS